MRKSLFEPVEMLERRAYLTVTFSSPITFQADQSASDLFLQAPVYGDFNGDGKVDMALAYVPDADSSTLPARIQIAAGNGAGQFSSLGTVEIGAASGAAAVGDFNHDGKLDLVLPNAFNNELVVLTGMGNGTFNAGQRFAVGSGAQAIAVGDINKDGATDVAVGNRNDGTVSVLFGNTSTVLSGLTTLTTSQADPASVFISDFNNDGNLDVVVGNAGAANATSGSIDFFPGAGGTTFGAKTTLTGPRGITAVADVNNDGNDDLITSVGAGPGYAPNVALGSGSGSFAAPTPAGGTDVYPALAADFDQDGNVDIATAGGTGTGDDVGTLPVEVLPGQGSGAFASATPITVAAITGSGSVGDVNSDGKPDLAFVTVTNNVRSISTLISGESAGVTPEVIGTLPVAVVGGTSKGKVAVRLTNSGTQVAKGPYTITLSASADGTVDGSDATLRTLTKKLMLKPGKSAKVNVPFTYPGTLPDGDYFLVAQVSGAATASSATTVRIAAPFVNLSQAIAAVPTALVPGKSSTVKVTVQNLGNVNARGPVIFHLAASVDNAAGNDVTLDNITRKINIKPGKTAKVAVKFGVPTALTAGGYFIVSTLDSSASGFSDTDASNDVAISATQATVS